MFRQSHESTINLPKWWNWQTRRTQNPKMATSCGFKSHFRHQKEHSTERSFFIKDLNGWVVFRPISPVEMSPPRRDNVAKAKWSKSHSSSTKRTLDRAFFFYQDLNGWVVFRPISPVEMSPPRRDNVAKAKWSKSHSSSTKKNPRQSVLFFFRT